CCREYTRHNRSSHFQTEPEQRSAVIAESPCVNIAGDLQVQLVHSHRTCPTSQSVPPSTAAAAPLTNRCRSFRPSSLTHIHWSGTFCDPRTLLPPPPGSPAPPTL